MKKLLVLIFLALSLTAKAQTNSFLGDLGQLGTDAWNFFQDAQPYFTNQTLRLESGPLYNNGHWGGTVNLLVPVTSGGQVAIGFGGAYLNGSWYDASLGVNLGTTWKVPVLGYVYSWVETGPAYNFRQKHALAQNFVGATKKWDLYKGIGISLSGMVGNISDLSGPCYGALLGVGGKF